ncbi:uncharacterized protein LOC135073642 [Ostrinia nubilalis]|uniref:uncharacterized protein LOC135073642 n=1 Tax=Ostrinia nubilalis TaxID=29057 RepID=UPI00308245A2
MDHLMTTEDSYAERRQLFKNIWETAMNIEDKDNDIMNKPKVIKTLRLDEVDRYGVNKKKKLKLKNLRAVCNKILDFCDRQEADDLFYEQMNAEGQVPTQINVDLKPKKVKHVRTKKKMKKSKSLYSPARSPARARATTSERKDDFNAEVANKTSRNTSPIKIRRANIAKPATNKNLKKRLSATNSPRDVMMNHKVIKKGAMRYYYVIKPVVERVTISPPKKLLQVHKITIN